MNEVIGIVKKINAKHGSNDRGNWTAYSICIGPNAEGRDGDVWYRLGFKKPTVQEGSTVKIQYEEDGRGNKKVVGDILVDKSTPVQQVSGGGGGGNRKPAGGGGGWNDPARQNSIVRQNATTTATAIARVMLEQGIVKPPQKKADQYDFVLELIGNIADHLFPTLLNPPTVEDLAKRTIKDEDVDNTFADMDEDVFEEPDDDKWAAV